MKVTKTKGLVSVWAFSFLLLSIAGCTHTYSPPKEPVKGYSSTDKIPLTVELYLSEELRVAKWERQMMGETWQILLGETLMRNAAVVAREAFSGVVVTNGATGQVKSGVGAILTPKMTLAEQTMAMWAFGSEALTVMLEWTLKDPQGNIVWVDTIKGEGEANAGNLFTHSSNREERVTEMLEDLFRKSFQAISSSRAIRDFAVARQTANAKGQ